MSLEQGHGECDTGCRVHCCAGSRFRAAGMSIPSSVV